MENKDDNEIKLAESRTKLNTQEGTKENDGCCL